MKKEEFAKDMRDWKELPCIGIRIIKGFVNLTLDDIDELKQERMKENVKEEKNEGT